MNNMPLDYDKFMLKQTQWRGEVTAKLESINDDIKDIKMDVKDIKDINRNRDYRTGYIAGGMAIIVMVIGYVIQSGIS